MSMPDRLVSIGERIEELEDRITGLVDDVFELKHEIDMRIEEKEKLVGEIVELTADNVYFKKELKDKKVEVEVLENKIMEIRGIVN